MTACYAHLPAAGPTCQYEALLSEIYPYIERKRFKMFGKQCVEGRATGLFSHKGAIKMRYSADPDGASDDIAQKGVLDKMLKWANSRKLRALFPKLKLPKFNAIFVNLYEDGNDYVSAHADKMRDMMSPCILSLSVNEKGGARGFQIYDKTSGAQVDEYTLDDGDIFLMYGNCQDLYKHGIKKEPKCRKARINLTFRACKNL